jgi:hypothetical protein
LADPKERVKDEYYKLFGDIEDRLADPDLDDRSRDRYIKTATGIFGKLADLMGWNISRSRVEVEAGPVLESIVELPPGLKEQLEAAKAEHAAATAKARERKRAQDSGTGGPPKPVADGDGEYVWVEDDEPEPVAASETEPPRKRSMWLS